MAGMKRFVTYIYTYEEKQKGGNTGFAKIEIRGDECRLEIHLRGTYLNHMTCKVYLFVVEEGKIQGIPVGQMIMNNGNGDFAVKFKVDKIGNTPFMFDQMEGIFLCSDDKRIFMSRWKEGQEITVSFDDFKEWEPKVEIPTQKTIQAENVSAKIQGTKTIPENKNAEAAASSTSDTAKRAAEQEEEHIAATEIPMRNIFPRYNWLELWKNLTEHHPTATPFADKGIICVKIELKDLRELPKRYWYLGNNSFLLHGFFNYHFIVIGKIQEDRWFIGVPGIYQNQERIMAAIFGFPEFLPEPVENQFGYWYRFIEE